MEIAIIGLVAGGDGGEPIRRGIGDKGVIDEAGGVGAVVWGEGGGDCGGEGGDGGGEVGLGCEGGGVIEFVVGDFGGLDCERELVIGKGVMGGGESYLPDQS